MNCKKAASYLRQTNDPGAPGREPRHHQEHIFPSEEFLPGDRWLDRALIGPLWLKDGQKSARRLWGRTDEYRWKTRTMSTT